MIPDSSVHIKTLHASGRLAKISVICSSVKLFPIIKTFKEFVHLKNSLRAATHSLEKSIKLISK